MADDSAQGTLETRKDAGHGGQGTFRLWQTALDLADKDEKGWRKSASDAFKRYRDEGDNRNTGYNILYSSIQTQAPAVYNSSPSPDARRRFDDDDPIGKVAAEALERCLSFSIDEYDFDCVMESSVFDMLLPGRGVAMVVYDTKASGEEVDYEAVRCEHVQWDDFRRGPGKKWSDVPWVAVRYRITREEAIKLNPEQGRTVALDHVEKDADKDGNANNVPDVFKRLTVWKIWDKQRRQIVFHAPSYKDGPLRVDDDILQLRDFFPFPRPMYDAQDSSTLIPLVPYEMYKDQAAELDTITRRIHALVKVLRYRGIRASQLEELDLLKDADDGDLIPSQSFDALAMTQGADPSKAIWLWPVDVLIQVLRELIIQRETIKQTVFEISGLADIMRGQTDPNETLGAQQIKAQWGSLRMQKRQREVQRFARDLLRLKAEIIGEHFAPDTLAAMTNIQLPTPEIKAQAQQAAMMAQQQQQPVPPEAEQALSLPTWEEVKQLMADDAMRSFRIDIETDSTIEADQTRAQQTVGVFLEGMAAFAQAFGPGIASGIIPQDAATDILVALTRKFNLGKKAEDALERIGKQTRQQQPERPDPEMAKVQAEQQRAQAEMQMKQQAAQADQQMAAQKFALDREKAQADVQMAREKAAADIELQREKARMDYDLKQAQMVEDAQLKREAFALDSEIKARGQMMTEDDERRRVEAEELASLKLALDGI